MKRLPGRRDGADLGKRVARNDLLAYAGVETALRTAQATMGAIVQDAREFRLQSNSSLETISDRALRESVGSKPLYHGNVRVEPTSPTASDTSSSSHTRSLP